MSNNQRRLNNLKAIQNNSPKTESIKVTDKLGEYFFKTQLSRQIFVGMFFIIIFLGIIALVYHYSISRKVQVLVKKNIPLFNDVEHTIDSSMIEPSHNLKETYVMYMTFDNSNSSHIWFHNFAESKIILRRLDNNFMVKYNPKHNHISIDIRIRTLSTQSLGPDTELTTDLHSKHQVIIVKYIPHQQWIQIAVVIDNRNVDVYLNKKLATSQILDNVPIPGKNSILIGQKHKNPNAFLGRLEYSNTNLTPGDIRNLYLKNMRFLNVSSLERKEVLHQSQKFLQTIYSDSPSPSS